MRIHGLISWHQESALWLAATVASAAKLCDSIVALDGAYALFPDAKPRSGSEQAVAIMELCAANDLACTIHVPSEVWAGNEVEKRTRLFELAEFVAGPDDWYIILDADEVVAEVPSDLRRRLETTDRDVAEVTFREYEDFDFDPAKAEQARRVSMPRTHTYSIRTMFRAIPGIHCAGNHYTYRVDGRTLWGNEVDERQEPALDCTDLIVDHRTHLREVSRRQQARTYYNRRDEGKVEYHACFSCKERPGSNAVKQHPERVEGVLQAAVVLVCDECYPAAKAASDLLISDLGFDPETLRYEGVA